MTFHGPDNFDHPEPVEVLLTEHLTAVLEPQRGKVLAAFRAHLASAPAADDASAGPAPIPISRGKSKPTPISRRELWFWTGVPSLVAACLAVALTLHMVKTNSPIPPNDAVASGGTIIVDSPRVNQYVVTQRATGAVVVNDNKPMQMVHQQEIHQTQWLDPKDNATYTLTQPVEKVGYMQVQPY